MPKEDVLDILKKRVESLEKSDQNVYKNLALRLHYGKYKLAQTIIGKGNMSKLFNILLDLISNTPINTTDDLLKRIMQTYAAALQVERERLLLRLKTIDTMLNTIQEMIREQEQLVSKQGEDNRIKELFKQLRIIASRCNYDDLCVMTRGWHIINELNQQYGFDIDREWIKRYLLRLRMFGLG